MKLGIDSRSINLHSGSGIGTYTRNLVLNLINDNINDDFNLIWTGEDIDDFKKDNTELIHTSGRHTLFYERTYVPNLMKNIQADLFHIPQNGIGFPFDYDLKTVVTIHDLIPYIMPETVGTGYLNRFLKDMPRIIESSTGILTVSEYSKKDILRFFPSYPEDKIFVTPLAANNNFKPLNKDYCSKYLKSNYKIDFPYILYLGGFSKRKNVKDLILAFSSIYNDLYKPIKLIILGSLKDEGLALKEMVSSLGLNNKIIFVGYVPDEILPIFYNGSTAFIYPSLYEGFGLPPLEAMKCGVPVITSNLTSIPEVTLDSALLINPNARNELKDSLIKLINSPSLQEELSYKSYIRSKNFSWNNTAAMTMKAYKQILNA